MAILKYGSNGDDVKTLQTALGFTGEDVDGIYGQKTERAVRDYQKHNNLVEDGIAGNETLGSLGISSSTSASSIGTGAEIATKPTPTTQTGSVQAADTLLSQWMSQWTDPYLEHRTDYIKQFENREPFSYDVNSDAMYHQLKDQYIEQGRLASEDVMGQAAAMTGGYGNSYAQSVSQQAYNQHLSQLNDIVPELYDSAYSRYQQEGQDMLSLYDLYTGLSTQDYNVHQSGLDNYYKALGTLGGGAEIKEIGLGEGGWNSWDKEVEKWKENRGLGGALDIVTARMASEGYSENQIKAFLAAYINEMVANTN